ncbi:HAMP domain-containing sensor histidine kinase [Oceanirhabdus sp. W0125-5]|nr:HAMP domain-containing sensor histidine kinase [Oceanirhabdus sp. W0125-5]WBW96292.1 HAMP domain-containing sensor histidine kinase [Oceanirhabdus sp. W0125-5]
MTIKVIILVILIIMLVVYIVFLQLQLRNINRQLTKRLTEHTRQPISLELINKELNTLAININKCLKAEETLRLKGIREEKRFKELIANISHDLRTPLTAIKGYQQLMEKGELSDDQRKKLDVAQKHALELEKLIGQFFEYSYLLNARSEPNLEQINVTNLVTECLANAIAVFEEKELTVQLEETQPVFALADKEMTVRIVQNLIRNCAVHSVGTIEVGIKNKENPVISFRNPVKNPAEVDVNRLFERFYTSDKSRNQTTGLGLSIVKMLAEQMDGRVGATLKDNMIEIWVELQSGNKLKK